MKTLWTLNGRPCEVVGRKQPDGQRRLRFLDGDTPADLAVTDARFRKATRMEAEKALYWRRVEELIQVDGMDPARASSQALAELQKGILAFPIF